MATTEQGPMTIDELVNKLKYVPGNWYMQVTNSDGTFYVDSITNLEDCNIMLNLKRIPDESAIIKNCPDALEEFL